MIQSAVGKTENGKKNGEWKSYYKNGQVAKIECYVNDTLNGTCSYFGENGEIKQKVSYNMGTTVDSFITYFQNGNPNLEEWKDSNGRTQGLFRVYHPNGQLSQLGHMNDDYLDDTCKTFFDNGQPRTIEYYKKRKKEGAWQYFSARGKLIKTEHYSNDTLKSTAN